MRDLVQRQLSECRVQWLPARRGSARGFSITRYAEIQMARSHLRLALLVLLGLPALGNAAKDERVVIVPDEPIQGQLEPTDERFMGYHHDSYTLTGKAGDQFEIKVETDVDVVLNVSRSPSHWKNTLVLTIGEKGGETGAQGTLVLPDDGTYYVDVYHYDRAQFGPYTLNVKRVTGFVDTASIAEVVPGTPGSGIKASGLPEFPEVPNIPELADIAAARLLYEELTADDWTPAVTSGGMAAVAQANGTPIDHIRGNGVCDGKSGPVEVRYQPVKDSPRQLVVFRGKDASCDGKAQGLTPGFYWFSDGQVFISSNVQLRRGNLRVRATGKAVSWNNGYICSGTVAENLALLTQTCWDIANNVVQTALSAHLQSPTAVPGRMIYPGLGSIEGRFQQGRFYLSDEANFVAHDGAYRTTGAIKYYENAPADAVRRTNAPWQLYLDGLTRFETKLPTALGPAGAYLYYGPVQAGSLPTDARPEPGTLAEYASLASRCPLQPALPRGWLAWGPSCEGAPDRLDAWSVDGRFRLRFTKDSVTVLQEFGAGQPGRPIAEWRAAAFTTDRIPGVVGTGELWRGEQLVFRGEFAGLAPEGDGDCGAHRGNGLEPCTFADGGRVDALYLARVEQRKLEEERAAEVRAREQAAAAERARVAAAQAEAARQAAAQRAAQGGGFQWGKLAALTLGAVAAGVGDLDAGTQANLLLGAVQDSMAGNQGMSNLQSAASSIGASSSASGAALGLSSGGAAGGSYPPRPNTLDGHPACRGYTVDNYKQYFEANKNGGDTQLHTMCAAAYNYYWMYLNAIRQGYSQQDSDRTYAAFKNAAAVATSYYQGAR
jgi:hypothetical protein